MNNREIVHKEDRLCLYLPVTVSSGVAYKNTGLNNPDCQNCKIMPSLKYWTLTLFHFTSWNKLPLPGPLSLLKAICHTEQGFLEKNSAESRGIECQSDIFLRTHSHTAVLQKQMTCLFFLDARKKDSRKLNINIESTSLTKKSQSTSDFPVL